MRAELRSPRRIRSARGEGIIGYCPLGVLGSVDPLLKDLTLERVVSVRRSDRRGGASWIDVGLCSDEGRNVRTNVLSDRRRRSTEVR